MPTAPDPVTYDQFVTQVVGNMATLGWRHAGLSLLVGSNNQEKPPTVLFVHDDGRALLVKIETTDAARKADGAGVAAWFAWAKQHGHATHRVSPSNVWPFLWALRGDQ